MSRSSTECPRILVLLATFNGALFIAEQVRSLATQRGVSLHVLASDDGSSDETVQLARVAAAAEGVSLSFLPSRPPTGSSALNFHRLLRDADLGGYDYVALCDQDDIWLENKLDRATSSLKTHGGGGYSCNSIAFWPDGTETRIRKSYPQRRWDYLFESASHGCTYVLTSAIAQEYQRFIITNCGNLRDIQFHDWLIYAWARTSNIPWIMDDEYLIRYRQSSGNVIGANAGIKAALQRIRQLRSGWFRSQSLLLVHILGVEKSPIAARLLKYRFADRIYLALHARHCRRRLRDAIFFGAMCLLFGAADARRPEQTPFT